MKHLTLKAELRSEFGKKAAKAARREGFVPCNLYGAGENVTFVVNEKELRSLIYTPSSFIVELDFNGKIEKAVMRETQFHPIREQVLHVDFYRVVDGQPVAIALPVRLTGKLALSARKLVVKGLMENLPDELVVDVTPLKVGQTIFVGDLQFEGLQFLSPATQAVCAVRVTRASRAGANQQ